MYKDSKRTCTAIVLLIKLLFCDVLVAVVVVVCLKAAKYETQKPSTCRATLFCSKSLSMFPVFHLAWSTCCVTKTFVAGWRNAAHWLVDLLGHEQICCATSCEFDEKRATKRQVDHARWKTGNINKNLQWNNVARQVEGFCVSYFAALRWETLGTRRGPTGYMPQAWF